MGKNARPFFVRYAPGDFWADAEIQAAQITVNKKRSEDPPEKRPPSKLNFSVACNGYWIDQTNRRRERARGGHLGNGKYFAKNAFMNYWQRWLTIPTASIVCGQPSKRS